MGKKKQPPVKFVAPKEGPNTAKWEPPFQYQCNKCRATVAPPKALTKLVCPLYIKGSPCGGKLVRFGKGSGRGSHFKKEESA